MTAPRSRICASSAMSKGRVNSQTTIFSNGRGFREPEPPLDVVGNLKD